MTTWGTFQGQVEILLYVLRSSHAMLNHIGTASFGVIGCYVDLGASFLFPGDTGLALLYPADTMDGKVYKTTAHDVTVKSTSQHIS